MKKLLVIAVALASVNASATRARLNSLNNSRHVIDTQSVYRNPADIFYIGGDYVNLESGNTNATGQNDGAEGQVTRTMGNSKMGLSIGHDSGLSLLLRGQSTNFAGTIIPVILQQNPIELTYGMKSGDMAWAATLIYSNYVDKTGVNKETSTGLRAGMRMGALDVDLGLGLANSFENAVGKFKGTMGLTAGAGMWFDTLYVSAGLVQAGFRDEDTNGNETKNYNDTNINVNVLESIKKDGNEFFYGIGLVSDTAKDSKADQKNTSLNLPLVIGLEQKATSWLTLRGSITQSVFLNNSRTEIITLAQPAVTDFSPGKNNTSVAIGAGLNFDKVTLDGSLIGATTTIDPVTKKGNTSQELSGNTLLGQVGLTYMF